jgi:hypothetical protein
VINHYNTDRQSRLTVGIIEINMTNREDILPRVIKAYEDRKAEMVAAAWSLFSQIG